MQLARSIPVPLNKGDWVRVVDLRTIKVSAKTEQFIVLDIAKLTQVSDVKAKSHVIYVKMNMGDLEGIRLQLAVSILGDRIIGLIKRQAKLRTSSSTRKPKRESRDLGSRLPALHS